MELKIIGSSSSGNGYVLDNGNEALLIECGMAWKNVQKAVNFGVCRIQGAIISHEHGDHGKHAQMAVKSYVPVYASNGTLNALGLNGHCVRPMEAMKRYAIGNFTVMPFPVQHDAAEPFGFLIHHPETGLVLFATDTYYLKYKFPGLHNIMLECNYRQDILDANVINGVVNPAQRNRTMQSHMSLDTCIETLMANDLADVNNLVLIHLSNTNSDAEYFRQAITSATGIIPKIARPGMIIPFNKYEF